MAAAEWEAMPDIAGLLDTAPRGWPGGSAHGAEPRSATQSGDGTGSCCSDLRLTGGLRRPVEGPHFASPIGAGPKRHGYPRPLGVCERVLETEPDASNREVAVYAPDVNIPVGGGDVGGING
jgi:hypothetical protein